LDTPKSQHPDVPWKQVAGLRDKVIHDYFSIDLEIVWGVVDKDLPTLRRVVDRLMSEP
jgi:uncharacterized protein with HEPN domain